MKQTALTLFFGLLSILIYLFFLGMLIFYFNMHTKKESKHYVTKNDKIEKEKSIEVSLAKLSPIKKKKVRKKSVKPIKKRVIKRKKVVKQKFIKKRTSKKKKVFKRKKVLKSKKKRENKNNHRSNDKNVTKDKKLHTLFSTLPQRRKIEKSTTSLFSQLQTKKHLNHEKGIKNSYLAKIEQKLKGWPAQADYIGQKAMVWFSIKPSGAFKFKVTTKSKNQAFNQGLKNYLRQLQLFGFQRHYAKRVYEINVEFIATE